MVIMGLHEQTPLPPSGSAGAGGDRGSLSLVVLHPPQSLGEGRTITKLLRDLCVDSIVNQQHR